MSKTVESYFYGQGRIFLRPAGSTGNGGWRWVGDMSTLTFGGTDETASHKESYSGQKAKVRSFSIGGDRTLKGTIHQMDPVILAELFAAGDAGLQHLGVVQLGPNHVLGGRQRRLAVHRHRHGVSPA